MFFLVLMYEVLGGLLGLGLRKLGLVTPGLNLCLHKLLVAGSGVRLHYVTKPAIKMGVKNPNSIELYKTK